MRTYCVTGGAGFIGSHLVESLLKQGNRVICIDNFSDFYDYRLKIRNVIDSTGTKGAYSMLGTSKEDELRELAARVNRECYLLETVDIRDRDALDTIFAREQIDAVIHLAAMAGVRPSIEDPLLYEDVNVRGTLNLLEVMRKHNVRKWLCASSSSVYGNQMKVPFSEADFVDRSISPYAATKKSCEVFGHTYFHLYGIDCMMLRFFTVFGPRQRPDLAITKFTGMMERGEALPFFGDGTTRRDYTYIEDIVDGIVRALHFIETHDQVFEIINLGTNRTIMLNELVQTLEKQLDLQALLNRQPAQPGDVEQTFADISKAQQMLGYTPQIDFEEGITKFMNWHRGEEHGKALHCSSDL